MLSEALVCCSRDTQILRVGQVRGADRQGKMTAGSGCQGHSSCKVSGDPREKPSHSGSRGSGASLLDRANSCGHIFPAGFIQEPGEAG